MYTRRVPLSRRREAHLPVRQGQAGVEGTAYIGISTSSRSDPDCLFEYYARNDTLKRSRDLIVIERLMWMF